MLATTLRTVCVVSPSEQPALHPGHVHHLEFGVVPHISVSVGPTSDMAHVLVRSDGLPWSDLHKLQAKSTERVLTGKSGHFEYKF